MLNSRNIVHVDSLELIGALSINFIDGNGEQVHGRGKSCRYMVVLYFFSYGRLLIVSFLNRGSGKTAFLHPKGTSLRRAANMVIFNNL